MCFSIFATDMAVVALHQLKARLSLRSHKLVMEKSPPSTTTGGKAPAKAVAVNMVAKTVEPEMEDYGWLGFLEMSERSQKGKRLWKEIVGWIMGRIW